MLGSVITEGSRLPQDVNGGKTQTYGGIRIFREISTTGNQGGEGLVLVTEAA